MACFAPQPSVLLVLAKRVWFPRLIDSAQAGSAFLRGGHAWRCGEGRESPSVVYRFDEVLSRAPIIGVFRRGGAAHPCDHFATPACGYNLGGWDHVVTPRRDFEELFQTLRVITEKLGIRETG